MARAIWTGSLAFGLVNVPVGLYSATEDKTVHFSQFEAGTSDRIRYKRVNERTGHEVDYGRIVKGYEVRKGNFVMITDEELEAVEPGRSRTIDITDFVDLDEIDPIYFQKTYYLAPQGEGADRSYLLLRAAMAATNKAGIATFVMRGKQYLGAVRAAADVLMLETMFFADEIRDPVEATGYEPPASRPAPRGHDRAPAHRVDDHRLGSGPLRGHLPRARRGTDREQADRETIETAPGATAVEGDRPHRNAAPQCEGRAGVPGKAPPRAANPGAANPGAAAAGKTPAAAEGAPAPRPTAGPRTRTCPR